MTLKEFQYMLLKDWKFYGITLYDCFNNEYIVDSFGNDEIDLIRVDCNQRYFLNSCSCWKFHFERCDN